MPRLSAKQLAALRAVAEGRVEWGTLYPDMERRAAKRPGKVPGWGSLHSFLIDGSEPYGADKRTLPALEERGLIRARVEDVPTYRAPAVQRPAASVSGLAEPVTLPERDVPEDPGWRAVVELTDAGRAALETHA